MRIYNVGIIGCGRIASDFEDTLNTQKPHSHAGAFSACKRTSVVAACDISKSRRNLFKDRWLVNTYDSHVDMINSENIEIVSICTPPETHLSIIEDILSLDNKIKAIFCEKPLDVSIENCKKIKKLCDKNNIKLAINTWRRWDIFHQEIKNVIDSGVIGKPHTFHCNGHVGIMNTGSHLIDLIHMYSSSTFKSVYGKLIDEKYTDPGFIGIGTLTSGINVNIDNTWRENQKFGITILGETGQLTALASGVLLDEYKITKDSGDKIIKKRNSGYNSPMLNAAYNIVESIENSEVKILSCCNEGINTMKAIAGFYMSHKESKEIIINNDFDKNLKYSSIKLESRYTSSTKSGR